MTRAFARTLLAFLCGLLSAYALLCTIPFAWNNFIADRRYPQAVELLLRLHPWLWLAAAGLCSWILARRNRTAALLWLSVHAGLGLWWLFSPLIPSLRCDSRSFFWALAAWEPWLSWELLLILGGSDQAPDDPCAQEDPGPMPAFLPAAALLCLADALALCIQPRELPALPYFLCRDLLLHIGAFTALACLSISARAFRFRRPGESRGPAGSWIPASAGMTEPTDILLFFFIASLTIKKTLLAPLSLHGTQAFLYALCAAAPMSAAFAARSRRAAQPSGILPALAGSLAALLLPAAGRVLFAVDWDFVLQTLCVLAAWALALDSASRLPRPLLSALAKRLPRPWLAACACAALIWAADLSIFAADPFLRGLGVQPQSALARLAISAPSWRTLQRLLRTAPSSSDFFRRLQDDTNLPRGVQVLIPELAPSPEKPAPSPMPDVFIFVIDSLRPDYLGAYAPSVRFTPNLDAFARDSFTFKRAFTVYGGTGLSEPALWLGALLPHQQYPQDLRRMNFLQKLIEKSGYLPMITMDVVLSAVLERPKDLQPLDEHAPGNYKFCDTLSELQTRLAALPRSRPVFVYTQPQDLHVSVIDREGRGPASDPAYPGAYAPYASRVANIDACFGRFTASLKKSGRYEDSVIVVTSDHGDLLGEDGRWGHASSVDPEVLRIPLLLHAPARLLRGRSLDTDAAALSIDLAPTLAGLLGCFAPRTPVSGRSLLLEAGASAQPRGPQLAASSYAPTYGLLLDDARRLYIADGANYEERLISLDSASKMNSSILRPSEAAAYRSTLLDRLQDIRTAYGLGLH
ncbi:MAG: sulfatase-like hydrolase/transferase [Elusimicrobiota bacterium]|jgi:hypothetical protein